MKEKTKKAKETFRVRIDERFLVDIDQFNYTLKDNMFLNEKGVLEKRNTPITVGYFGNMKMALKEITKYLQTQEEADTLNEYIEKIERIHDNYANVVDKLDFKIERKKIDE